MLAQGKTPKVAAVADNSKSRLSALSKGDGGKPLRYKTRKGNYFWRISWQFLYGTSANIR